jgi:hypothetical protein
MVGSPCYHHTYFDTVAINIVVPSLEETAPIKLDHARVIALVEISCDELWKNHHIHMLLST